MSYSYKDKSMEAKKTFFPRKLEVVWNSKKATAELADKTFLFVISDISKKIIDAFLNSSLG